MLWEQEAGSSSLPVPTEWVWSSSQSLPVSSPATTPASSRFRRRCVHGWSASRRHRGCPVALSDLRLITLTYRGFDGRDHTGRLIANREAAAALVTVFRRLYEARFPIRRMEPVDRYGGDDFRSIEADNTSAFNCRTATDSTHWSNHAYGRAIDVNPIENPYTGCGRTREPRSIPYLDRSRLRRGMVTPAVVGAFRSIGWGWGGSWAGSTKD